MPESHDVPHPQPSPAPAAPTRRRVDWLGRAMRLTLVVLVSAAGGLLLAPFAAHRLPGPDALGLPAPLTIKADRDYDIVDAEATARRRADAAAAERPLYDHDAGAADEAAARVHAAFELMRGEETELRSGSANGSHELERRYAAQRDAFVSRLQVLVRDEDLAALGHARFSQEVEHDLAALAQKGLSGLVVEDAKLLPAGRDPAFAVRTFRDGALQSERTLADVSLVRTVERAREEVARTASARLERAPPALRAAIQRLAVAMVRPTLVHNQAETERRHDEAAARVKPVVIPVKRGEKIIGDGERIEPRHLIVLEGIRAQRQDEDITHVRIGGGALIGLLVVLLWGYARRNFPRFRPARRDALLMAGLLVGTLALGFVGFTIADALHERFTAFPRPSLHYLVPFAAGAMIVRQVLAAETALLFSLAAGLSAGLLAGQSMSFAIYATLTSLAAAGLVPGSRDRAALFRAGLAVGLVGVAVTVAIGLHGGKGAAEIAVAAAAALAGGAILLPVAVVGILPAVEGLFGYVTDVKLLELANLNHPALKELIVQAPGTYHHAILMGAMVEAAAQAVGANPLLAKVCAYYHDLGKIRNPAFFAENQRGENRHDGLAPSMSALIIKRHVTDGLELARQWRLPSVVTDTIPQHHGTRLVGYFWARALKSAAEARSAASTLDAAKPPTSSGPPWGASTIDAAKPPSSALDESLFRYPGPKPQTREAALVMIADACEASARALAEPTEAALSALVSKRVNEIFSEGQLDECELTLKDLNAIAGAMVNALEAIYHTRPAYPPRAGEDAPAPPSIQLLAKP